MYYCILQTDGYIIGTASSTQPFPNTISAEEAANIRNMFLQKPKAEEGYEYRLKEDLTWELVELPPEPEPDPTPEEALSILLGGVEA